MAEIEEVILAVKAQQRETRSLRQLQVRQRRREWGDSLLAARATTANAPGQRESVRDGSGDSVRVQKAKCKRRPGQRGFACAFCAGLRMQQAEAVLCGSGAALAHPDEETARTSCDAAVVPKQAEGAYRKLLLLPSPLTRHQALFRPSPPAWPGRTSETCRRAAAGRVCDDCRIRICGASRQWISTWRGATLLLRPRPAIVRTAQPFPPPGVTLTVKLDAESAAT
eukprot:764443-Hanusia_phi.AAC.10